MTLMTSDDHWNTSNINFDELFTSKFQRLERHGSWEAKSTIPCHGGCRDPGAPSFAPRVWSVWRGREALGRPLGGPWRIEGPINFQRNTSKQFETHRIIELHRFTIRLYNMIIWYNNDSYFLNLYCLYYVYILQLPRFPFWLNVLLSLWFPSLIVIFATWPWKLQVACALIRVDSARQALNVEIEFSSSNLAMMKLLLFVHVCTLSVICDQTFTVATVVPRTALITMLWGLYN